MKAFTKEYININKAGLFVIRYAVSAFLLFSSAFILLRFPSHSAQGVKNGIDICLGSLVPGLYPFMIITNLYLSLGMAEARFSFIDRLCRFMFRLPGCCATVILFSLIGGLPIGAGMSAQLYERGMISREQCRRMLCFCVNPGPAFVISVVGHSALNSEKAGLLIYLSLILSSLIIGVLSGFFTADEEVFKISEASKLAEKGRSCVESAVVKSSKSIFGICAWVVAFSCFSEIISNMGFSEGVSSFLMCITEMTRGSVVASESYPIPVVAAVIGFSGICGHFQLLRYINAAELKYKFFLVSRIINAGLSAVICGLLLKLFPVAEETFSVGVRPERGQLSGSVVLSVLMILMAALFVLGDDYRVTRKKLKKL